MIGDVLTLEQARELTTQQRRRLRKRGVIVPRLPRSGGSGKQTAEHINKRIARGEHHYKWQGHSISERGGRARALRAYPDIGPCTRCGSSKAERHHIDGNTSNNNPENIAALCRRCHMEHDGRLEKVRQWAKERH